jgi:hypothetical protein
MVLLVTGSIGGLVESTDEYKFQGKVSAFRFLNPLAVHQRIVIKKEREIGMDRHRQINRAAPC